jgi:rifampicin phosphotransferase
VAPASGRIEALPHLPALPALGTPEVLEWLKPLEQAGASRKLRAKKVGGKAAALGQLVREGYDVPRGWVIEARHFQQMIDQSLPRGHDLGALVKLARTKAGIDRAARARDRILSEPLPEGLVGALEALWKAIEAEAPWGLAVRSSATCEDREDTSLAGLATTVLGARGPEAIGRAVQRVWASALLPAALTYLVHIGVREIRMGVVLQIMIPAEAAGVLFTAPPPGLEGEHWREGERLVNATFGLGAPVVDGAVSADTVRLSRRDGAVIDAVVADKPRALVVGEDGVEEIAVPPERRLAPSLPEEMLAELAALADRLEQGGKGPFDVEFAVEAKPDGSRRLWLLQARPITGYGFPEGGDASTVWSRTNVGEALPGAATPLTWSVARAFSDKGFREAFGAFGCRVPRGATLVGNIHGRFYLNLTAFMQIAAQVPGLTPQALLRRSGGAGSAVVAALERQTEEVSRGRFLSRLPLTAPRQILRQARLEREVSAFEVEAERARRVLVDLDLSLLPDDALATTLRSASDLLARTGTLMLACASASLASHLALVALLDRVLPRPAVTRERREGDGLRDDDASGSAAEPLAQALVGGVREIDSAGPGIALARLAEIARQSEPARARLLAGEVKGPDDLPEGLVRDAFMRFLELHGDRAVREAELATPRWREDPRPLLAMLVAALRAPPSDPDRALARARAVADREMARLETQVSGTTVLLVRTLVARTQRFIRLRERMRAWVTRVLGMIRTAALDIDRRLLRIDPTLLPGSVFFCTFDELIAALRSGRAEIGHVVRLRKAEHARDAARPDPPATFIGRPQPIMLPPISGAFLAGLPASGGVVEGRARVLEPGARGLEAVGAGEILISRTTDVGLSPLFLVAAAVVTELGGPLSHAAVVAREYGIPAVVSVPGATLAIKNGDRLRVDGDRGIVERLVDRIDERAREPVNERADERAPETPAE